MKAIFKGNKFAIQWTIKDAVTSLPFDFTGMFVEYILYSDSYKGRIVGATTNINKMQAEIPANILPVGVYNIICKYRNSINEGHCIYRNAFQITRNPEFIGCDNVVVIESFSAPLKLENMDINYLGHFTSSDLLIDCNQPSWALVGKLNEAEPWFFYTEDAIPAGSQYGWNNMSEILGTYNLTKDKVSIYDFNLITEYNVSRNHTHTERKFSPHWGATTKYYPEYKEYSPCKIYEKDERVNMPGYTENSFIALHQTSDAPYEIINETSEFSFSEAINLVPEEFRFPGIRMTYVKKDTHQAETWFYKGGSWENKNSWVKPEGNVTINNSPDEEDIASIGDNAPVLKLKDKVYNPQTFSGLGRTYLRKNMINSKNVLTQAMFTNDDGSVRSNTRYIIQYDYDLNGSTIAIPKGCVLDFQGGSIKNGTITGNYTQISGETNSIFDGISIKGTWNVPSIKSSMFLDAEKKDCIKNMFALSNDDIQNDIVIEDGQYIVTTSWSKGAINLTSNTVLVINGVITLEANNYSECFVLNINGKSNIHIKGEGVLSGDKLTHTGNDGEWGHGINIIDSHNISISGITIKDCWGDCIYVGGTNVTNAVRIDGCIIDNGRRQGISVSGGTNIIIENCVVKNIKGTAPESGIDIEPNGDDIIHNVCIRNNYIYDCSQGILVGTTIQTGLTEQVSIENNRIINCNGRNRDGSNTSNASSIFVYGAENYNTKNIVVKNNIVETFTSGYTVYFSNIANVLIEGNRIVNSIEKSLAEYPMLMAFFSIPDTITLSNNTLIMPSGAALRNAKIYAIANTVKAAKMFPFDNIDFCEFNNNNIDARLEGSFNSCVFSSNTFNQLVYFNSNSKRNIIRQNKFASIAINGGTEHNDVVFNNITNLSVQDPVGYNFVNNKISQLSSSSFYDCIIKENDFTNIANITKLDNSILENNKFSDLNVTNVVRSRLQKNTFSGNFTMQYASYSNIVENNFKEVSFGTNPISNTIFDRNICDGNIVCYILNTTISGNKAKKIIVNSTKQSCIVNNILEGDSAVLSIYGGDTTIVKNNIATVTKKDTSTVNVIYIACSHSTISENIINPNNTARYAIQLSAEAAYNNIVDNIISSDVASGGRVVGPNTSATNYFDSKNRNRIGSTSQRPVIENYNNTSNETEKLVEYYDETLKAPIYWNGGYWQYEDGTMALTRKGSTAQRPNLYNEEYMIGFEYYDTDLKKKILWNGSSWTNIDGTSL